MLVLPAWQDAPRSSLNTLCLKTTTTSWQSEGWRTTISCSFFCFVFVVVSLHKTTTKTAKSSIHTQPRPNTVPNSCWTSICNLHPHATWSRSLFTFSKDYNTKLLLNCQIVLLLSGYRWFQSKSVQVTQTCEHSCPVASSEERQTDRILCWRNLSWVDKRDSFNIFWLNEVMLNMMLNMLASKRLPWEIPWFPSGLRNSFLSKTQDKLRHLTWDNKCWAALVWLMASTVVCS